MYVVAVAGSARRQAHAVDASSDVSTADAAAFTLAGDAATVDIATDSAASSGYAVFSLSYDYAPAYVESLSGANCGGSCSNLFSAFMFRVTSIRGGAHSPFITRDARHTFSRSNVRFCPKVKYDKIHALFSLVVDILRKKNKNGRVTAGFILAVVSNGRRP